MKGVKRFINSLVIGAVIGGMNYYILLTALNAGDITAVKILQLCSAVLGYAIFCIAILVMELVDKSIGLTHYTNLIIRMLGRPLVLPEGEKEPELTAEQKKNWEIFKQYSSEVSSHTNESLSAGKGE